VTWKETIMAEGRSDAWAIDLSRYVGSRDAAVACKQVGR
jgi:hypothetical protein